MKKEYFEPSVMFIELDACEMVCESVTKDGNDEDNDNSSRSKYRGLDNFSEDFNKF